MQFNPNQFDCVQLNSKSNQLSTIESIAIEWMQQLVNANQAVDTEKDRRQKVECNTIVSNLVVHYQKIIFIFLILGIDICTSFWYNGSGAFFFS